MSELHICISGTGMSAAKTAGFEALYRIEADSSSKTRLLISRPKKNLPHAFENNVKNRGQEQE